MDADQLRKLIDRQLDGDDDGPAREQVEVAFLKSGDTATVTLQRLTPSQRRRGLSWSLMAGDFGEAFAHTAIAGLRWAVVDEDGQLAFDSYEQARQFVDVIDDDSYDRLGKAMGRLGPIVQTSIATKEDPEAGKAS